MHRCLLIDEIFTHILGFLGDEDDLERRCNLARLARTCKAFKDPALDLLWRNQTSLVPLVMLLPLQLWSRDSREKYMICWSQRPHFEDWAGLLKYSHRIRSMMGPRRPATYLHPSALEELLSPQLFYMLFPSLEALDFHVISVPATLHRLLPGLLPSSFIQLCYVIPEEVSDGAVAELLNALPARATSLRTLEITSYTNRLAQLRFTEHHWPHLQTFILSLNISVNNDGLRALMHLRDLAQPAFTALELLTVAARSLDQCSDLLSKVASRRLVYLSITYDNRVPEQAFHTFLGMIARFHDRSPLFHTFFLNHYGRRHRNRFIDIERPVVISPSTLAPLLACHQLRVLRLGQIDAGAFDVDDAFMAKAARAWPALTNLGLISARGFIGHGTTLALMPECCQMAMMVQVART